MNVLLQGLESMTIDAEHLVRSYTQLVDDFKLNHGIHKIIAFSGGTDDKLEGVSNELIQRMYKRVMKKKQRFIIEDAMKKFRGYRVAILTGGTRWGVPLTATVLAKKYGFLTIGVYPFKGKKDVLGPKCLDLALCVEPDFGDSHWGDESILFTKLLDGVIVYGGGAGTLIEMAHVLKLNESLLKRGSHKYIVPIAGSGGVADELTFVWGKTEIRQRSMPLQRILSGSDAADFLIDKLGIEYLI